MKNQSNVLHENKDSNHECESKVKSIFTFHFFDGILLSILVLMNALVLGSLGSMKNEIFYVYKVSKKTCQIEEG